MKLTRPHHQEIHELLKALDAQFLQENQICFGGGTRIVMELDEYRESVDIDLFCAGRNAYRAARSTVGEKNFGSIFLPGQEPTLFRGDIRADRDAIRTVLNCGERPIKFEIIHFDGDLSAEADPPHFPVPVLHQESCFSTKLLANADRHYQCRKDIVDLCMMRAHWGEVPESAWQAAFADYGEQVVINGVKQALEQLIVSGPQAIDELVSEMACAPDSAARIVNELAPAWRDTLSGPAPSQTPSP